MARAAPSPPDNQSDQSVEYEREHCRGDYDNQKGSPELPPECPDRDILEVLVSEKTDSQGQHDQHYQTPSDSVSQPLGGLGGWRCKAIYS